jgi:site-specific DNA-methyltransferase (adenine-specific)
MLELNHIYTGDCLTLMREMPDKSVDLVLTDPPYSSVTHKGMRSTKNGDPESTINFDCTTTDEILDTFSIISQKAKGWIISFMDWRFMHAFEENPPKGTRFIRFGIWNKTTTCPQFTGDRPGTGWEAILFLHKDDEKLKWNGGGCGSSVYSYDNTRSGRFFANFHPTEKPIDLLGELITLYSNPKDLVFDPFTGSGSTHVACKKLGRNFIGIEKEPAYVAIAEKRLEKVNNHKITDFFGVSEEA